MALTFKSFVENGGGELAFLWHVAGYPWAVTDNANLITALSNTGNSTVQAARKRLFGSNEWTASGTVTPAYTVPIFPGLIKEFGKLKYDLDESKGLIKGGDWHVKVEDRVHGNTWQHAATGDEIWGLEGLHRVAQIKDSEVHGWAYLTSNLLRDENGFNPSSIFISEQSGQNLRNRVNACSGDDYVVVWMNHEAIAVDAVDGTYPDYELDICNLGQDGRGLYRSRTQDHFTYALDDLTPIVSDVPGSIAGHYCWLYAIPLINGSVVLNDDSEPLIAEIEGGVVTPNISTKDSVTTVQIRNKLSSLEKTVSVKLAKAAESSLTGFVFCRGNSGTELSSIYSNGQMPHFIIREYNHGYQELVDYIANPNVTYWGQWFTPDNFEEKYIWLCPKNSFVTFETAADVQEALNKELDACYNNSDGRNSENVTLLRPYIVTRHTSYDRYYFRYFGDEQDLIDELRDHTINAANYDILYPRIGGVLAWLFALGTPCDPINNLYTLMQRDHIYYQYFDTVVGTENYTLSNRAIPYSDRVKQYWMYEDPNTITTNMSEFRDKRGGPVYYYSWDWVNGTVDLTSMPGELQPTHSWDMPTCEKENYPIFLLNSDINISQFPDGENLTLGDGRRFPKLRTSVDECIDLDWTDLKGLKVSAIYTEQDTTILQGTSLFYLPWLDLYNRDQDEVDKIDQPDPHYVYRGTTATSTTLSGILRGILGETISGIAIAKEIQLSHIPFFTTEGDFTSSIDWTSLDTLRRLAGQDYWLEMETGESVYKIIRDEVLFHAGHMTREWDESSLMFIYRFRTIGPVNRSSARTGGWHLNANKTMIGVPIESHGLSIPYNSIHLNISGLDMTVKNQNASIVGTDERSTLDISPRISRFKNIAEVVSLGESASPTAIFTSVLSSWDINYHMIKLIISISKPNIVQTKNINTMQWLFPVGKEIRVTDTTARKPFTHGLGLDLEPALVTNISFDIAKQKGDITYKIGGTGVSPTYGIAPALKLSSGNFSKIVGEWSGTPDDHIFTTASDPKDVFFFDCYDFPSGPSTPIARYCSCSNYKVWAHEKGAYNDTPLEYTCSVNTSGVITLYGDTTDIDTGKDYIITFREWADLEDCQKYWCTMSDDNNTIGSTNEVAHRWI